MSVPRSALRGTSTILTVNGEQKLHFRTVEVYRYETDRVIIKSGLDDGDLICLTPLETAVENMPVRIVADGDLDK